MEEQQVEKNENTNTKHKLPYFVQVLYWLALVIFGIFIALYLSQINSITIFDLREQGFKENGYVYENGIEYELLTTGEYAIVKKENAELAVINITTGEFIEKTFFLKSANKGILKITSNNIMPAKPSISYALFEQGIFREKMAGLKNPPTIYLILLPLVIAIFAHGIVKLKSEDIASTKSGSKLDDNEED